MLWFDLESQCWQPKNRFSEPERNSASDSLEPNKSQLFCSQFLVCKDVLLYPLAKPRGENGTGFDDSSRFAKDESQGKQRKRTSS
jgi:hypothetical protein